MQRPFKCVQAGADMHASTVIESLAAVFAAASVEEEEMEERKYNMMSPLISCVHRVLFWKNLQVYYTRVWGLPVWSDLLCATKRCLGQK